MTAEHADAFAQLDVPARLRVGGRGLTPDPGALRADRMVSDGQDGHGCPLPEKPTLAAIPIAPAIPEAPGPSPGVRPRQTGDQDMREVFPTECSRWWPV
jgi:hypothetical protein